MEDLQRILKSLEDVEYADVRYLRQREVEVSLRHESSDVFHRSSKRVVCKTVSGGYGIASTDRLDKESLKKLTRVARTLAKTSKGKVMLCPVKVEKGKREHQVEKEPDTLEVSEFLASLKDQIQSTLHEYVRSELVVSYYTTGSSLLTSEGTSVYERTPTIDITLYLIAKRIRQGFASKIIGGQGGFEVVENQEWKTIIDEVTTRAKDGVRAKDMPGSLKGGRYNVILDSEAAGAFVHELGHMLEADVHQKRFFHGLNVESGLEVVDDPTLEGGYGSFTWDDEGVKADKKILLHDDVVSILHTRLTAPESGEPGNAHGVIRMPRPIVSNIYITPSDWEKNEMVEDTRKGFYIEGVIQANCDISDGRFELTPELSYHIKNGRIREPIKHLKITGKIMDLLQRIDAIGKAMWLRPNLEKGFGISEGGPHIRIDGAPCF